MLPPPSVDSSSTPDNVLPDYSIYPTCAPPPPDYLTLEDQTTCYLDPSPWEKHEPAMPQPETVTTQRCHDLISFLYSVDHMLKTIPQGLQRLYMCRAELRYVRWLQVLQREKPTHTVTSRMIIPPLDVMLCWYAHMLSSFRYHDDLIRNSWEHVFNYPLPLEKTREIKTKSGTGKDPLSERFWAVCMPDEPYDLDLTELRNDDHAFTCVFCQESQESTWTEYTRLRCDPSSSITCLHCGSQSSTQTISCYQFVRDILESSETQILFKGLMLDSDGQKAKSNTEKGLKVHLMARFMKEHDDQPVLTHSMLQSSTTCDWNRTLQLLKSIRKRGKDRFREDMTWTVLLDTAKSSYFGIITPLCIDMIQAVGRQHAFLKNVVSTDWINVATLRFAIHRYRMFLTLIKQQQLSSEMTPMVPTVDIDLCWHVHLVSSPQDYVDYCVDTYDGKVFNHDDTIPESNQYGGAVLTAMLWHKKFKEPYTTASFVAAHHTHIALPLPSVVKWVKKKAIGLKKLKGSAAREKQHAGLDEDYGFSDDEDGPNDQIRVTEPQPSIVSSDDELPFNLGNMALDPMSSSGSTLSLGVPLSFSSARSASTHSSSSASSSMVMLSSKDKYHLFLNAMTDIALHNQAAVNAWYGRKSTTIDVIEELDRHVLYFGNYGYIGTTTTPTPSLATKFGARYKSF